MKQEIKIGTRSSALAIKQVKIFIKNVEKSGFGNNFRFKIIKIKTSGDCQNDEQQISSKSGFKGVFTKEIQEALIEKKIDIAIHSVKDLPAKMPDFSEITSVLKRKNREDGFFSFKYKNIDQIPKNGKIGTSSIRRAFFIKKLRPDIEIVKIRGNINTRIDKMKKMNIDAIILSYCGPRYLKYFKKIKFCTKIPHSLFIPAIGQGAIGVEILRENNNEKLRKMLQAICNEKTKNEIEIEKKLAILTNASCQTSIACSVLLRKKTFFEIFASYENEKNGQFVFEHSVCKISEIDQKIFQISEKINKIM